MATEYQIKLQYNKALSQASRLEELADELLAIGERRMNNTIETIQMVWKGQNAEAYIGKGIRLKEKIISSACILRKAAETIRAIAENTYKAEMQALEVAKRRTYGGGE